MHTRQRRGTSCGNWTFQGTFHGSRLAHIRNATDPGFRQHKSGTSESQCVEWNALNVGKVALSDLLPATGYIESNDLDEQRVGEIRDMRIIERDVAIFAEPDKAEIYRSFRQEF